MTNLCNGNGVVVQFYSQLISRARQKKNYHPRSFKSQGTDDGILSTMLKFRGNHINHDT